MFTTFPAHKKRPAAGAGTHDRTRCRGKCLDSARRAYSRRLFLVIILHFSPLVHTNAVFFTYYRAFAQTSTGFSGNFWFSAAAESDKKAAGPTGPAAFEKAKDKISAC